MRFGIREICEVVLRAKTTMTLGSRKFYKNEPVLYFDTLKTSSLEGASTTVYATGGRGNTRLVAWEGERTLTFTMEDALISPESFSILSGAGLIAVDENAPIYVHTTSQVEVKTDNTIILPEEACWNKYKASDEMYHQSADIFVMTMKDGKIAAEPCIPAAVDEDHKTVTCYSHAGRLEAGDIVLVDYYVKRTGGAQLIEITADKFGGNYYLEAQTLFRDEATGVDMPAEFIIPNCKVQSNFTFTMAATGDPSTFTFTMDAFPDYTKFDRTHKVLAAIQVITDDVDSAEEYRTPCKNIDTDAITAMGGATVTYDNDTTEDFIKVTVEGSGLASAYDKSTFGTINGNVIEIDVPHEIGNGDIYKIIQTNPAVEYLVSAPTGTTEQRPNGTWVRTTVQEYDAADHSKYQVLLSDKPGAINVKFYKLAKKDDATGALVKTIKITNKVSFAD